MNITLSFTRFAVIGLVLSSCSLGHSASDDLKSSNPAVALQAQKVVDLQQQVDAQDSPAIQLGIASEVRLFC